MYRYFPILIVFSVLIIIGCASSNPEIGFQYLEQKNYKAAISAFDSAAAVKAHPRIYYGYFQAYMGMDNFDTAIKYLTIGLSSYPNDAWLNLCAGHWYMKNGKDPRKALSYYEKASTLKFGKSKSIMNAEINKYIRFAKDQIVIDSIENNLKQ